MNHANHAELERFRTIPAPLGGAWTMREIDPAQFEGNAWFDVPYADQSAVQTLDVIVPAEGAGPFPVIFYIPGGGWVSGDKRAATMTGIYLAPRFGFALCAVNYRYATDAVWPAQIFDVKAALRFLRAHAADFNVDPDRVVAWGNSAGGHLANMLGATGGHAILEDRSQGNAEQSCEVSGLISWYGISDLLQQDLADQLGGKMHPLDPTHPSESDPGTDVPAMRAADGSPVDIQAQLLGFAPQALPQAAAMASPICFVQDDFPPALFQHGMDDSCVPWTQSVAMARHINDVCGEGRATFELFEGGHGTALIKADENVARCFAFARQAVGLAGTDQACCSAAPPSAAQVRIR